MKLLFISPRIPYPPDKGDKVRSSHELQAFIERGHEVHLLAFADDLNDLNYQVDLGRMCATVGIVPLRRVWAVARALVNLAFLRPLSRGYSRRERCGGWSSARSPTTTSTRSSSVRPQWRNTSRAIWLRAPWWTWRTSIPRSGAIAPPGRIR